MQRATVISGTFRFGAVDTLDHDGPIDFGPGNYTSMLPEMRHFKGHQDRPAHDRGAWEINYVNSGDDPRLRD